MTEGILIWPGAPVMGVRTLATVVEVVAGAEAGTGVAAVVVTAVEGVGAVLVDVVTALAGATVVDAAAVGLVGVVDIVVVEVDVAARPPPQAVSRTTATSSGRAARDGLMDREV